MAFLVPTSKTPMVFDTLPAYKVQHYVGTPAAGKIYCYMRMYCHNKSLAVSFYAFERDPASNSRMGAVLQSDKGPLYLCVAPQITTLHRLAGTETTPQQAETAELLVTMPVGINTGQDEQGWYWGMQPTFSPSLLATAGVSPTATSFHGALFKYHTGEAAFGASVPVEEGQNPLSPEVFDTFTLYENP